MVNNGLEELHLPGGIHLHATANNNMMHAKPDLRVFLEWMIARSGSVITAVIPLGVSVYQTTNQTIAVDDPLGRSLRCMLCRGLVFAVSPQ